MHRGRNRRPIADTIAQLLAATRAHAGFAIWPTGEQALANILRMLDKARRYEARGGISFRGFVDLLEAEADSGEGGRAPVVEEGTEGVRMMTVHSAKGLEFPVVILADMTCKETGAAPALRRSGAAPVRDEPRGLPARRTCSSGARMRNAATAKRAVRLLYVAATRARDLLVVPVVGDRSAEQEEQEADGCASWRRWSIRSRAASARRNCVNRPDARPLASESVLPRPSNVSSSVRSVAPGLHCPSAGAHRVVWWDPAKLQLNEEEAMGLRQVKLLQADESGGPRRRVRKPISNGPSAATRCGARPARR